MAVPVRADLMAQVADDTARLMHAMNRRLSDHATVLTGLARGLGDPAARIEQEQQRVDFADRGLEAGMTTRLDRIAEKLERRVPTPMELLARTEGRFETVARGLRLQPIEKALTDTEKDLTRLAITGQKAMARVVDRWTDRLAGARTDPGCQFV